MWIRPGTPGDIHFYNTDAHRNYVGYRFDGTPTTIELKNCRAYANRTYGLMDNTGAVIYWYCHLYANNLATGVSTDVTGAPGLIDGGNNIAADTPPNVRGFMQYPARITVTYDDPGLVDGSHQYIEALLPMIQSKGIPLSIAVVTGYALLAAADSDVSVVDQRGMGCQWPLRITPILCFSKRVHDSVHGERGYERDAFDFQQPVHNFRARRSERAGELEP